MPVTIACPKCQTKYKLPDSSLGKAIKCQKCGAGFKTKARTQQRQARSQPKQPTPAQQAPAQGANSQQRAQEMAKLGIDGPLRRQGDIFGAALPQGAGQLGNFAGEDPGFDERAIANVDVEQEEQQKAVNEGMESILDNPFVSPSSGGGVRGRVKKTGGVADGYGAAKVGMWLVYISSGVMIGVMAALGILTGVGRFAPFIIRWLAETGGPVVATIIGVLVLVCMGLAALSVLAILVGQVCCIFSPNKDEKLFAGLAVGAIVLSFLTFLGIFLMGLVSGIAGEGADGTRAALGLLALLGVFAVYALVLANLFLFIGYFKRVGKNIGSKKVVKASKTSTVTCISAIALGIISAIVMAIVVAVAKGNQDTINMVADIAFGLNMFLWFSTTGSVLAMVKATLDVLKKKSSG